MCHLRQRRLRSPLDACDLKLQLGAGMIESTYEIVEEPVTPKKTTKIAADHEPGENFNDSVRFNIDLNFVEICISGSAVNAANSDGSSSFKIEL